MMSTSLEQTLVCIKFVFQRDCAPRPTGGLHVIFKFDGDLLEFLDDFLGIA